MLLLEKKNLNNEQRLVLSEMNESFVPRSVNFFLIGIWKCKLLYLCFTLYVHQYQKVVKDEAMMVPFMLEVRVRNWFPHILLSLMNYHTGKEIAL